MSEKITATYGFAQTFSTANTAFVLGPKGKRGSIVDVRILCTVSLTGAAGLLSIGTPANPTLFGTMTLPNTTAVAEVNGLLELTHVDGLQTRIGPDEWVEFTNDAAPTAGAGILFITIDWE